MECTILHVLAGLDAHSHKPHYTVRPRKKFVPCNGREKNRVGRLIILFFYFILFKNVFYACFMLIGSWKSRAEKILG